MIKDDEKIASPGGMNIPPEALAKERGVPLDMGGTPPPATKLRKEIRMGLLAFACIVVIGIIAGMFKHTASVKQGKTVDKAEIADSAVSGAKSDVDDLKAMSEKKRAGVGAEGSDPTKSSAVGNDVADELGLQGKPPTQMAQIQHGPGSNGRGGRQASGGYGTGAVDRDRSIFTVGQETAQRFQVSEEAAARKSSLTAGGNAGGIGGLMKGKDSGGIGGEGVMRSVQEKLAGLASLGPAGLSAGRGAGQGAGGAGMPDQNEQVAKEAFVLARRATGPVAEQASIVKPFSKYEVKAGWDIPATLEQAMNSDLPGEVRGLVRENVYDSTTGRYLLIPQGSRVIGEYNSHITYGQSSVQVVWTRLIYPNGSSLDLGGLNGQDMRGLSGFRDKVDNHYVKLIGSALLTSGFAAGIQMTQKQSTNSLVVTPSQMATQAMGQQLGQLGERITERNLNVQPTVKISIGYRFTIRVRRDLVFDRPYGAY